MAHRRLKFVRKDEDVVVLTEHPDHIHPRDLSASLLAQYDEDKFQISLRRNIYVIYINREAAGEDFDSISEVEVFGPEENLAVRPIKQDQKLEDIKLAEKVLKKARIPKS